MNPAARTHRPDAPGRQPAPASPSWRRSILSGCMIWALTLFMASPPFSSWSWRNVAETRAGDFLKLCNDPLSRDLTEGILAYRIATPVIAWLLHLPAMAALALPYLFSLLAMIVMHRAISLRSDPQLASVATIGVGFSSAFFYAQGCLGLPDGLTQLGTAVALIGGAPLAAFAVLVGFMNDERAVLALPFIALWRFPQSERLEWLSPRSWLLLAKAAAPLAAGLAAALFFRHALKTGWIGPGITTPPVYIAMGETVRGFCPWLESWGVWFVNCLKGPGWLWLLILPPCLSPRWRPGALPAVILGAAFILVCLSTFIVADVARSIGFAFPAALLGCVWMHDREPEKARKLALIVASLQVVTPALWIYQGWQWLQFRPFPWEVWLFIHSRH